MRESQPLGCARADRSSAAATVRPQPPSLPGRQRQPPGSPGGRAVDTPANCRDGSSNLAWGQSPSETRGRRELQPLPLGSGESEVASLPVKTPATPTAAPLAPAFRQPGRQAAGAQCGRVRGEAPLTASWSSAQGPQGFFLGWPSPEQFPVGGP